MGEKVTIMVLKVDLQCHKCYKKVKKVLCKFPQIQDQIYDEKQNQVVIKVVCCSPEKIKDKICCKGGSAIISIKIKEPEKPKCDDKPKCDNKPKCDGKPKCDDKPKCDCKPKDPVVPGCSPPVLACCMDCYHRHAGRPCNSGCGGRPCNIGCGGRPCSSGCGGRPCSCGCGGRLCSCGCGGRPVYNIYDGGSWGYCVTRPDYFSEENPSACTVM